MNSKYISIALSILCISFIGCAGKSIQEKSNLDTLTRLQQGNEEYITASSNSGDISKEKRQDIAVNGQFPYAVLLTCSDSRVVPEHIFTAGLGELFVIRNAGNVVLDIELGSIEYGAEHLQADTIIVMGHTDCGAVGAAIMGNVHGNVQKITDIIQEAIGHEKDITKAVIVNIENSISQIMTSESIQELLEENKVRIRGALYNLETGKVEFL